MLQSAKFMATEHEILKALADKGDCVIVGRAADIILEEQNPFSIFVCADEKTKLNRCHEKAENNEELTDKEILSKCREIDKRRADYRAMFTEKKWRDASGYHLCVNTSGMEIKKLIPSIANYIENWFSEVK